MKTLCMESLSEERVSEGKPQLSVPHLFSLADSQTKSIQFPYKKTMTLCFNCEPHLNLGISPQATGVMDER